VNKEEWLRELKHIYGSGILFFYYAKWPILIGLPALYYGLDYPHNTVLDILWVWSLILVFKDIYVRFVLKKSYCQSDSCTTQKDKEHDGDNTRNQSE